MELRNIAKEYSKRTALASNKICFVKFQDAVDYLPGKSTLSCEENEVIHWNCTVMGEGVYRGSCSESK